MPIGDDWSVFCTVGSHTQAVIACAVDRKTSTSSARVNCPLLRPMRKASAGPRWVSSAACPDDAWYGGVIAVLFFWSADISEMNASEFGSTPGTEPPFSSPAKISAV